LAPLGILALGDTAAPAPDALLLLRDGGCGPSIGITTASPEPHVNEDYVPLRRPLVLQARPPGPRATDRGDIAVPPGSCPAEVARQEWLGGDEARLRLMDESLSAAGDWIAATFGGSIAVSKGWGSRWLLGSGLTLDWVLADLTGVHDEERIAILTERLDPEPPRFLLGLRLSAWDEFTPAALVRLGHGQEPFAIVVRSTRIPGGTAFSLAIVRPDGASAWIVQTGEPFLRDMVGHD
jgi:hypothetical protein